MAPTTTESLSPELPTFSLSNQRGVGQFCVGRITVNGGCVNFKLAKMLRIQLALTLLHGLTTALASITV